MSGLNMTTDLSSVEAGPALPDTIVNANKLMLAGAALALVSGVISAAYEGHRPSVAALNVAAGVIVGGIWWLVARACRRGRHGGRILGSVFFAFSTLGLAQNFAGQFHVRAPLIVLNILSWLVGLGATVLLWRRDSAEFFLR